MRTYTKSKRVKFYCGVSRIKHRCCRTDDSKINFREEGTYLPNFFISNTTIQDQKPEISELQDNSRNGWLTDERISKIVKLSKSTGKLIME